VVLLKEVVVEIGQMPRAKAVAGSVAWFIAVGGTFGCLLPYLSGDWHFHPAPLAVRVAGVILIGAGLIPLLRSFADFIQAGGRRFRWPRHRGWC
jgi:hypothetical protein